MIILDTNVLSALMRRQRDDAVIAWLDRQAEESIWTTTVSVFEVEYGVQQLARGRRRSALGKAFESLLARQLQGRILAFDMPAALAAGQIAARLRLSERTVEIRDVQIAGIARARRAAVATRNVRHFEGTCDILNPWTDRPDP